MGKLFAVLLASALGLVFLGDEAGTKPSAGAATATAQAASKPLALSQIRVAVRPYVTGFNNPVGIAHAGDGSGRLFVVEKAGRIQVIQDKKKLDRPFLDITPLVDSGPTERGLLGLAFHPKYEENGYFYIYYTAIGGDVTIVRYKVSDDPNTADPSTAKVLLTQPHPRGNHNGGQLVFGPDNYLYTGFGDGGGAGDPDKAGQSNDTLAGKILRLDVDNGDPYAIPPDNPFKNGGGKAEIWSTGWRNPWRFSFDRATNDLYIADVGQNRLEEVNVEKKGSKGGLNYGWSVMEGTDCYPTATRCDKTKYVLPVAEYDHGNGCSITGGFVYRGKAYPSLVGTYFYADFCSGKLWGMQPNSAQGSGKWQTRLLLNSVGAITSFGEDEAGEVYLAEQRGGAILQLTAGR
jgi:glucose/arabinose dehydrogenase